MLLPELQLPTSTFASSMRKTHLPGQPTLVVSSTLTTLAVRDPGMLKQRLPSPALKPAWEESNKRQTTQTIEELQTRRGMRSRSCWTWPAVIRVEVITCSYLCCNAPQPIQVPPTAGMPACCPSDVTVLEYSEGQLSVCNQHHLESVNLQRRGIALGTTVIGLQDVY